MTVHNIKSIAGELNWLNLFASVLWIRFFKRHIRPKISMNYTTHVTFVAFTNTDIEMMNLTPAL